MGSSHDVSELHVLNKYFGFIHNIDEPKSWLIEIDSINPLKSLRAVTETYPMELRQAAVLALVFPKGIPWPRFLSGEKI